MKIYRVDGYDKGNGVQYFEPTRKRADARMREMKLDGYDTISTRTIEIAPTREGVAGALNDLVDLLAANEH